MSLEDIFPYMIVIDPFCNIWLAKIDMQISVHVRDFRILKIPT